MAKAGAAKPRGKAGVKRTRTPATGKTKPTKPTKTTPTKTSKPKPRSKPPPTTESAAPGVVAADTKTRKTPPRGANGQFAATGASETAKGSQTPRALVLKIYKTIDGELTKLEKQKGSTSQDRERASRALSQITSSLERAAEMQRELAKASSRGAKKSETEALRHAEDMRRQIAERIERLGQSARFGKPAG